ncbi:hypothetical protein [Cellulomonas soli]|uniref:Polysaccharide biosynthesis protein n=1 Tax=Cellulomonas soli TaxID=931535 RepID=A0A512P7Y0_9CELL|nr:hypothetical protein [Cellulomonas soli]NYI57536.1 PST family polysaccharide transporter [Cellulomonas soli]GEP67313.1 hypothetical protein CSO01_00280 [Cellulomonas soli]
MTRSFWGRLAGFAGLPAISLITPLLVLPVLGRAAGADGWASLLVGESVGTLAAIVVNYGWNNAGPPRVAEADTATRLRLYRESLLVRGALAVGALPVMVVVCASLSADGFLVPTVLMGLAGAVPGLSFAWYAVGVGDPRPIAVYEAVPRVVAAAVSSALILWTGQMVFYPLLAVSVSLGGIWLFGRTLGRSTAPGPGVRDIGRLLVRDRAVAVADMATGAFGTVPVPVASRVASPSAASSYASADKLYKYGQYVPITLANALQSWTVEVAPPGRPRRLRLALVGHGLLGVVGAALLAVLGPTVSGLLFGQDVRAARDVCLWLALAFAVVSVRMSLVRHFLLPAGRARAVLIGTALGAALGVVGMLTIGRAAGAAGVAASLAVAELVTAVLLVQPALRHLTVVEEEAASWTTSSGQG